MNTIDVIQEVLENRDKRYVLLFANRAQATIARDALQGESQAVVYSMDSEYAEETIHFFNEKKLRILLLQKSLGDKVDILFGRDELGPLIRPLFDDGAKTVYVAIWNDRHVDTTVHVFTDETRAVEWARKQAKEYDRFGEYEESLTEPMKSAGWVFHATYSGEGDSIWVVKTTVDGEQ